MELQKAAPLLFLVLTGFLGKSCAQSANTPPKWVAASYLPLTQGIPEDTPLGTTVARLQCTDVEGDNIIYAKVAGDAFTIRSNGDVILQLQLDFDVKENDIGTDLEFSCVDIDLNYSELHNPVVTRIEFTINDANDNAPLFDTGNAKDFEFSILESLDVGTVLTPAITVTDEDRTINARLDQLYFICDPIAPPQNITVTDTSMCDKFQLNFTQTNEGTHSASIVLKERLDYEIRPIYSSQIIAVDGPGLNNKQQSTTVAIQIRIEDAQDRPPFFTNVGSSATIPENTPVGTTLPFAVMARDGDTGEGARRPVRLELIQDNNNVFELAPTSPSASELYVYESRVVLRNALDRETLAAYPFVVKVTELANGVATAATATATFSIFASDVNDNGPKFEQDTFYINVTEKTLDPNSVYVPVQVANLHIQVQDNDEQVNANYTVAILDQSQPGTFSVTGAPGGQFVGRGSVFLQVDGPQYLDYDRVEYRNQVVRLVARETGGQFTSTATVSITLLDINDNSPQFVPNGPFNFELPEDSRYPTTLNIFRASDLDSGPNGVVSFRLEGGFSNKFAVNSSTGALTLVGPLDYEQENVYVFLVYATDTPGRFSQAQVTVTVSNVNDLRPVFSLPQYETSANETSLQFLNPLNIVATDNEDGTVRITYKIVLGQTADQAFTIDPNTGKLGLRVFLRTEDTIQNRGYHLLQIEASDNGVPPLTSRVVVKVNVFDQNNHAPVLQQTTFSATISELAPAGTYIAQVTGSDLDSGDNGRITYRLGSGSSGNFFVNATSGEVSVAVNRNFDYDVIPSYNFQVLATDGGAPQKRDTANITVILTDANNKPPSFDKFFYRYIADEGRPVGFVIADLGQWTKDSDLSANLTYSLTEFTASDQSGNILNDRVSNYDFENAFAIAPLTGVIRVNGPLDKDAAQEISFKVAVEDVNCQAGCPQTATARVTILIEGSPDTTIRFDPIPISFMNEDAAIGYKAATVTANDPNSASRPIYSKDDTSISSDYFNVATDGQIKVARSVDYESGDRVYRVVVRASAADNSGRYATATVTVSINDVNDNLPIFSQASYRSTLPETSLYPSLVTSVFATDRDSSSFGPIEYRIAGGLGSSDFIIFERENDAVILVAENVILDYNSRNQYVLDILAIDNPNVDTSFSNIRQTSTAKLTITIRDENNHSPLFKEGSRSYVIAETSQIGHQVSIAQALDNDVGENGRITYTLEAKDPNNMDSIEGTNLFRVDPNNGILSVAQNLLGKGGRYYSLMVRAMDNGEVARYGTMDVDITVLSTENNDGMPLWRRPPSGTVLFADEEKSIEIVTDGSGNTRFMNATAQTGTTVVYELSPSSDFYNNFRLNQATGQLEIIVPLDREEKETYQLLVYAVDTSNPLVLRTGRTLLLRLRDTEDNHPAFTNVRGYSGCPPSMPRPLDVQVTENTMADVTVMTLSACDPDGVGNNGMTYSLYNDRDYCRLANAASPLRVSSDGRLLTKRLIDYEETQEFNMCVQVNSLNPVIGRRKRSFNMTEVEPLKNNVAYIQGSVIDLNDNGPKFTTRTASASILASGSRTYRSNFGSNRILTFNAEDPDGKGKNAIFYQVLSSVFYGPNTGPRTVNAFKVEGGGLYTRLSSYKEFSNGVFVLKVKAQDVLNSSMSDNQTVSIYVYEQGQAVKLVLNLPASVGYAKGEPIIQELNSVEDRYAFQFLSVSEHKAQEGGNTQRTDVCFLVSDVDTQNVLNIGEVVSLLGRQSYSLVLGFDDYKYLDRGTCYAARSSEEDMKWKDLWWVLVAVGIFIFVCCLILIVLACVLFNNYKRYMKTRKTYLVQQ